MIETLRQVPSVQYEEVVKEAPAERQQKHAKGGPSQLRRLACGTSKWQKLGQDRWSSE